MTSGTLLPTGTSDSVKLPSTAVIALVYAPLGKSAPQEHESPPVGTPLGRGVRSFSGTKTTMSYRGFLPAGSYTLPEIVVVPLLGQLVLQVRPAGHTFGGGAADPEPEPVLEPSRGLDPLPLPSGPPGPVPPSIPKPFPRLSLPPQPA